MSKFVGAHVSASGGVFNAVLNAKKIGAKAFALFTKNQRQWSAKELDGETVERFKKELLDSLKKLYGKLTNPDTKLDEKTSITLRLLERAEARRSLNIK